MQKDRSQVPVLQRSRRGMLAGARSTPGSAIAVAVGAMVPRLYWIRTAPHTGSFPELFCNMLTGADFLDGPYNQLDNIGYLPDGIAS